MVVLCPSNITEKKNNTWWVYTRDKEEREILKVKL